MGFRLVNNSRCEHVAFRLNPQFVGFSFLNRILALMSYTCWTAYAKRTLFENRSNPPTEVCGLYLRAARRIGPVPYQNTGFLLALHLELKSAFISYRFLRFHESVVCVSGQSHINLTKIRLKKVLSVYYGSSLHRYVNSCVISDHTVLPATRQRRRSRKIWSENLNHSITVQHVDK